MTEINKINLVKAVQKIMRIVHSITPVSYLF